MALLLVCFIRVTCQWVCMVALSSHCNCLPMHWLPQSLNAVIFKEKTDIVSCSGNQGRGFELVMYFWAQVFSPYAPFYMSSTDYGLNLQKSKLLQHIEACFSVTKQLSTCFYPFLSFKWYSFIMRVTLHWLLTSGPYLAPMMTSAYGFGSLLLL